MTKLIKAAIEERKVTILLSIIILLFGVYAYYVIPKSENPDTSSPAAQIITQFPGASANEVEKLVTNEIESAVSVLDGIDFIQSFSYDNASVVIVMLNYDVDYEKQWNTLRNEIDGIQSELPTGAIEPDISTDMTDSAGFIISLSGEKYTQKQLEHYANQLKSSIQLIDGIETVEISGIKERFLEVEVNNEKLAQYSLSIGDIYDLLQAQNTTIPPGAIDASHGKINIQSPSAFENIRDIENLIIDVSKSSGHILRLKDVANIAFKYRENDLFYKNNEEKSLLITGFFKDNKNIVLIGKDVRNKINQLFSTYPDDLKVDEVLFLPEDVDQSINNFIMNLLQGMVLVIIVVLIGMGKRNSVIVSFTIPLSIAITFIAMIFLDIEVQQVSIAALIIALGILVDNSIVISDAIQVKINEGHALTDAAYEGAVEQAIPVLSSTLTTVAAFAPLMVLPGEAGEFAKSLPLVFIIALTASYIVAMLVTPALASKFFHENIKSKDFLAPIKTFYHDLLDKNLTRPKRTLLYITVFFMIVLLSAQFVNIKMFPNVDKDLIYFNLESEIKGDIKATEAFVTETESFLANEPAIQSMTSAIGGGLPRFYMTADIITEATNKGQILSKIDLSKDSRFDNKDDFANYLQLKMDETLIGGHCTVNLLEINMPGPSYEARLISQDYDSIIELADLLYNRLIETPGTLDVKNSKPSYNYEYALDIDEDLLSTYGLTKYDVQYQLNLSLNGSDATIMKVQGEEYKINLSSNISTIDEVKNLSIRSSYTNEKILIKQFAKVYLNKKLDVIKHYNREMQISVSSRVLPELSVTDLESQMSEYIDSLDLPENIKIDYGGESEVITKYLRGLVFAGLVALVAVYIILLIQFNSLKQPLIILATIPLSFIGIIIMLLITRTPFTFTVGLGIASLFGIVVNNAILLIEYINRGRSLGLSVRNACIQSVEKRIRPILLSTITTIFGLIPLVLAKSSFFTPMAIALIGGLLFSTVLTLTIIPTIYYLLEK